MPKSPRDVARANWSVHVGALCVVVAGWLAVVWTHPDRDGINGLGDGILVFIVSCIALGYAALSSIALLLIQKTPRAAWMVHGGAVVMTAGTFAAMFAVS